MDTLTSTTTTADLYLMNCCLRVEIPMLAFSRLSDVLNNVPGIFLHGALLGLHDDSTDDADDAEFAVQGHRRDFVVRLQDVLFVRPLGEDASATPFSAERRERLHQRMVLQLDGWRISGRLHLVDHVRWVDFATAMNTRFIAVTEAIVTPPGRSAPLECPFLLVNGARLSAVYEDV